jgi:light-regulated signal transduction histidine kinase (bacteriophytochrome)
MGQAERMKKESFKKMFIFCCYVANIAGLYVITLQNDQLFHSIIKIFGVIIAFAMIRIFRNHIINAVKFCHEQVPQIHIAHQKQKNRRLFSVLDNSIGIALQYRGRIFRIFQWLHTIEQYPGYAVG